MKPIEAMTRVEERAYAARRTMSDVCKVAGVAHSTWCRAKSRGFIRPTTLARIEDGIAAIERHAAEAKG